MGIKAVADHYNAHLNQERERLDRHRIELAVTQKAFKVYWPLPSARVLDVGCGTGRYVDAPSLYGAADHLLYVGRKNLALDD